MYTLWRHSPCTLLRSWMPFLILIKNTFGFSTRVCLNLVLRHALCKEDNSKIFKYEPMNHVVLVFDGRTLLSPFFESPNSACRCRHLVPPCLRGSRVATKGSSRSLENYHQGNSVECFTLQFVRLHWKCTDATKWISVQFIIWMGYIWLNESFWKTRQVEFKNKTAEII